MADSVASLPGKTDGNRQAHRTFTRADTECASRSREPRSEPAFEAFSPPSLPGKTGRGQRPHGTKGARTQNKRRPVQEVLAGPAFGAISSTSLPGKTWPGRDGRLNVHLRRCRTREMSDANRSPSRRSVRRRAPRCARRGRGEVNCRDIAVTERSSASWPLRRRPSERLRSVTRARLSRLCAA